MIALALAVLLGVLAFPLLLVFGPVYWPWSLFVLVAFGGALGLTVRAARWSWVRALALAIVTAATACGLLVLTSNAAPSASLLLSWFALPTVPLLAGATVGAMLRARRGVLGAAAGGALALFGVALLGTGLAFALAPAEAASAPSCMNGQECPRTWCAQTAERRRLLAIERVTAFDGSRIRCMYTAWGGIQIGEVDAGPGGASWTDGGWPKTLSGR